MKHYTYQQFKAEHPDDAACLAKIMEARYGGTHIECPGCKKQSNFHAMGKRRAYACQRCGHHLYPCVGTPFAKSRTPLSKWLFAIWLFTTSRHGIAARELERQIGVSHKCAWRMAHEIRKHMARADHSGPLSGHVEIDETAVGGRPRYRAKMGTRKSGRGAANKTIVLGMVEREGNVRTRIIPDVKMGTIHKQVTEHIAPNSKVTTDELGSYRFLGPAGYEHSTVAHGKLEWARGDAHVNSIEGFWSRLKLSIRGTHTHVSPQHLWKYAAEFSFRYNMRKEPREMYHRLISSLAPST